MSADLHEVFNLVTQVYNLWLIVYSPTIIFIISDIDTAQCGNVPSSCF